MAIAGVFVLSPDSLLIRLAGLDDYTLFFCFIEVSSRRSPSA